jgi:hypothetical protein
MSLPSRIIFAFVATLSGLAPTFANADVGPAPACPTGTIPGYLRGRYCAPIRCENDAQCSDGATCTERSYCLGTRADEDAGSIDVYEGTCSGGDGCDPNARCATERFCGPSGGRGRRNCEVLAPGAQRGAFMPLPLIALALAAVFARRMRR